MQAQRQSDSRTLLVGLGLVRKSCARSSRSVNMRSAKRYASASSILWISPTQAAPRLRMGIP